MVIWVFYCNLITLEAKVAKTILKSGIANSPLSWAFSMQPGKAKGTSAKASTYGKHYVKWRWSVLNLQCRSINSKTQYILSSAADFKLQKKAVLISLKHPLSKIFTHEKRSFSFPKVKSDSTALLWKTEKECFSRTLIQTG